LQNLRLRKKTIFGLTENANVVQKWICDELCAGADWLRRLVGDPRMGG